MPSHFAELFARPGDGVALFVEHALDQHGELDVFATVLAVSATRLLGTERGELRFPVTERMRLDADDVCDFADFEEELVGKLCAFTHHGLITGRPWRGAG